MNSRRCVTAIFAAMFPFLALSTALAVPVINVISPKAGSSSGSPVFFEASATSSCAKGISAMRIYTAPGVSAYTAQGAHIETFVDLGLGGFNTVVQAWDNCGAVAKVPIFIMVIKSAQVSIFLPNSASAYSPVHFAASAENPSCPAGIAAMRIYSSWGFTEYTVDSNKLDAYVALQANTYNATIQAWDNCGNVIKNNFTVQSLGGDGDSFLYTSGENGVVSQFNVSSNGSLTNPNGSGNPPQVPSGIATTNVAVDPGGWFAYTGSQNAIYGYQINRQTGALTSAPGSPYALSGQGTVFADPAGNFLYAISNGSKSISSYRIDRSSGSLTLSSSLSPSGNIFTALSTDPYGGLLYAATNAGQVYGFRVNPNNGALTPAAGSPFSIPGATYAFALTSAYQYLYVGAETPTSQEIYAFEITLGSGFLQPVPGNPYSAPNVMVDTQSVLADWLTRYLWTANQTAQNNNSFWEFGIDGLTGSMGPGNFINAGTFNTEYLAEGHSAKTVYVTGGDCGPVTCIPSTVDSWSINGSGLLEHQSGPFDSATQIPTGIALARQHAE